MVGEKISPSGAWAILEKIHGSFVVLVFFFYVRGASSKTIKTGLDCRQEEPPDNFPVFKGTVSQDFTPIFSLNSTSPSGLRCRIFDLAVSYVDTAE